MKKHAILMICDESPFPAISGASIRNAALARALKNLGTLHVVTCSRKPFSLPDAGVKQTLLMPNGYGRAPGARSISYPLVPKPNIVSQEAILEILDKDKPAIVVITEARCAGFIPIIKESGYPVIYDMHNIESDLMINIEKTKSGLGKYFRNFITSKRIARQDKYYAETADQVWLCSPEDQKVANDRWDCENSLIPNPVPNTDVLGFPITLDRYQKGNLLFIGTLFYKPNRDAVSILVDQVMPNLPESLPLTIAGRAWKKYVPPKASGNVTFKLNADDLTTDIRNAAISPIPLVSGGGTRIKAIEAMAAGMAIVATAKAIEGLDLESGKHFIKVDTPQEMVDAIKKLVDAPEQAMELAVNAREYVRENFTQDCIDEKIANSIQTVLGER